MRFISRKAPHKSNKFRQEQQLPHTFTQIQIENFGIFKFRFLVDKNDYSTIVCTEDIFVEDNFINNKQTKNKKCITCLIY
jgi:hypothetical protein